MNERQHISVWQICMRVLLQRPRTLALIGVALIGLLALLYLNQVAGVAQANNQLGVLDAQHARLEWQQTQLEQRLGEVTSPTYIDQHARQQGLAPARAGSAVTITATATPSVGGH